MANINDVINGLKTKYNITDSTTEQELLELLNVVTVDEINAIKATSVIPLPNVVKGSPQELKERFVKIVSDEQRGIANVINTRMGLLRIFLAAYMTLEAQRLGDKVNFTDILDSLDSEATDKALSAKQGKVLKDLIDTLTVGTDRLVDGSVSESKLANNSVSEAKIKAGAITTDKLADDSVSNDKVKVNAIHTRNIKNGDITFDKLAQEVINYIDGIASGNSVYRGRFESVDDLPAYSETIQLHNNDYAYVIVEVEVEDEETHEVTLEPELARYKYSNGAWAFEYIIPNTSFSADEWEAIKSGITSTLVNKLRGIETGAQVNVQADWNENDSTKDEYIKNKPNVVTTDTAQEISQDKTFNDAKIKFKNSAIDIWEIRKNGSTLEIIKDNAVMMQLLSNIIKSKTLVPRTDDESLGNSSNKWKDIWLSGSLKDGTNELSLAQLKNAYDKALSAVQDANYVHTDNNYTTAEKNKLAGLSNYDDTTVRGLITAETSRATSQEQKALYHLGAFDSADGNAITRQTGYLKAQGNWVADTPQNNLYRKYIYISNNDFDFSSNEIDLNSFVANYKKGRYLLPNTSEGVSIAKDSTGYYIGVMSTTELTSAQINALNITIQYKLATSYTEGITPNQPLLTLDQSGCNWLREEWEKGLNLLKLNNISNTVNGGTYSFINGTLTINGTVTSRIYSEVQMKLEPNKTYTICTSNPSPTVGIMTWVDGNFNAYAFNQPYLVKTTSNNNTWRFSILIDQATYNNFTTKIWVVEGSHPYPYSQFNQKEHITNPQAELLKSEWEKCSNLIFDKIVNANIESGGYIVGGGNSFSLFIAKIEQGKQYAFSTSDISLVYGLFTTYPAVNVQAYDNTRHLDTNTFVSPINGYVVVRGTLNDTQAMLNYGDTPEPYHEYCGEILHEVDGNGTLLWENSSPNSAFTNQNITTADMSGYKYLVIEYKESGASSSRGKIIQKFVNETNKTATISFNYIYQDTTLFCLTRKLTPTSSTTISIGKGFANTNEDNDACVPIHIYGTNIL